jgi:hypothetical protein
MDQILNAVMGNRKTPVPERTGAEEWAARRFRRAVFRQALSAGSQGYPDCIEQICTQSPINHTVIDRQCSHRHDDPDGQFAVRTNEGFRARTHSQNGRMWWLRSHQSTMPNMPD